MKFNFNDSYLSINRIEFPQENCNDFMVLTGFNGSGKTHFLKAIHENNIILSDDSEKSLKIQYFDYIQFKLKSEVAISEDIRITKGDQVWKTYLAKIKEIPRLTSFFSEIVKYSNIELIDCIRKIKTSKPILAKDSMYQTNLDNQVSYLRREISENEQEFVKKDELKLILEIAKKLSKEQDKKQWWDITKDDVLNNILIDDNEDFLHRGLSEIFSYYVKDRDDYSLNYGEKYPQESISEEEKRKKYLKFIREEKYPWDEINESLKTFNKECSKSNFLYEVDVEKDLNQKTYQAIIKNDDKKIDFSVLSSGEQVVLALMIFLYNCKRNQGFPDVLLLDEIDATLHPDFIRGLLRVLENMNKNNQTKIILSTHNISTIAYAQEACIYTLEKDENQHIIKKQTKEKALEILSSGFVHLSEENNNLGIEYNLNNNIENKPVLFVEGITDKIILENAWKKLKSSNESLPFLIQDCFDASFLKNMIKREDILENYRDTLFLALFDFDSRGYSSWKDLHENKNWNFFKEEDYIIQKNNRSIYALLLPVFEDIKKQVLDKNGDTFLGSKLDIELMFSNISGLEEYFKESDVSGGGKILNFNGNKRDFSQKTKDFSPEHFKNFKSLFVSIEEIIGKPKENL